MAIDDVLAQNRAWAAAQVAGDPQFFTRHLGGQRPRLLWIGCSDSRVPAEQVLGCGPGDLFIHRNVANVVPYNDINITAVLEYALGHLHIPDVVLCGHYGCGGVAAACADELLYGYIGDWLNITRWARRRVDERLAGASLSLPREEYLRLVVEENVRLQVEHLTHLSVVRHRRASASGLPCLHGWVYDMASGLIRVIVDGRQQAAPAVELTGASRSSRS